MPRKREDFTASAAAPSAAKVPYELHLAMGVVLHSVGACYDEFARLDPAGDIRHFDNVNAAYGRIEASLASDESRAAQRTYGKGIPNSDDSGSPPAGALPGWTGGKLVSLILHRRGKSLLGP